MRSEVNTLLEGLVEHLSAITEVSAEQLDALAASHLSKAQKAKTQAGRDKWLAWAKAAQSKAAAMKAAAKGKGSAKSPESQPAAKEAPAPAPEPAKEVDTPHTENLPDVGDVSYSDATPFQGGEGPGVKRLVKVGNDKYTVSTVQTSTGYDSIIQNEKGHTVAQQSAGLEDIKDVDRAQEYAIWYGMADAVRRSKAGKSVYDEGRNIMQPKTSTLLEMLAEYLDALEEVAAEKLKAAQGTLKRGSSERRMVASQLKAKELGAKIASHLAKAKAAKTDAGRKRWLAWAAKAKAQAQGAVMAKKDARWDTEADRYKKHPKPEGQGANAALKKLQSMDTPHSMQVVGPSAGSSVNLDLSKPVPFRSDRGFGLKSRVTVGKDEYVVSTIKDKDEDRYDTLITDKDGKHVATHVATLKSSENTLSAQDKALRVAMRTAISNSKAGKTVYEP